MYKYDILKSNKNQKSPITITPLGSKSQSSYSSSLATSFSPTETAIKTTENIDSKGSSWETGLIAQNFTCTLMKTPANYMTLTKFTEYVQSKFDGLSKVETIVRDKYWVEEKKKGFLFVSRCITKVVVVAINHNHHC